MILRDEELLQALFRSSVADLGADAESLFLFLLIGQFPSGLSEPAVRVVTDFMEIDLDAQARELCGALGPLRRTGERGRDVQLGHRRCERLRRSLPFRGEPDVRPASVPAVTAPFRLAVPD